MTQEPISKFDAKAIVQNLTSRPGVYRMLAANGEVLYVGKARNLKQRVASYFTRGDLAPKTRALVSHIAGIEVTVTHTENEALILENNLIKEIKPRYNIVLRDDKSYPYIYISSTHEYPRLSYHRGAKREQGRYLGPYPSAGAVRDSLDLLQKLFRVRQCEDSFFANRTRPCLQYQIKRCTAPCVGYISAEDYARDVCHAVMFLEGRDSQLIDELAEKMEQASIRLDFEQAAQYRDQITSLRRVIERQYISGEKGDLDVIACQVKSGVACVEVFFIRAGHNLGNKTFYPQQAADASVAEVLSAFIPQYYLGRQMPAEIILNEDIAESELLEQTLSQQSGSRIAISVRVKGDRARWLAMAETNAEQDLLRRLASKRNLSQRFTALQEALQLDDVPQRLECFDISHTAGQDPVASCVVFNHDGPLKSDYRRFNITGITPGDDYAAMKQALSRRYTRLKKGEAKLPDILFIDGGKGQVSQAEQVLNELQINAVTLIGIAKGPARIVGEEVLYLSASDEERQLPADSPALHLIQQIRDEAHRFALTGHRQRRAKAQKTSTLEQIPGIGAGRRRLLLKQFGGLQGVARAGIEDLAGVKGINRQLAQRIYDIFHGDSD